MMPYVSILEIYIVKFILPIWIGVKYFDLTRNDLSNSSYKERTLIIGTVMGSMNPCPSIYLSINLLVID